MLSPAGYRMSQLELKRTAPESLDQSRAIGHRIAHSRCLHTTSELIQDVLSIGGTEADETHGELILLRH